MADLTPDLTNFEQRKLTVEQVAHLFSVSNPTVRRWVKKGLLPEPEKYGSQTTRWDGAKIKEVFDQRSA